MAIELFPPMTIEQAESWFGTRTSGRFNPDGPVSQLWWKTTNFPELIAIDEAGSTKFFRFADGTVIRQATGGAPSVVAAGAGGGLPDGVDESLAETWFGTQTTGRFNPNGPVSKLWLGLGRFPALIWEQERDDRKYFRFADGTVIYRPAANADFRVLGAKTADGLYPDGMDKALAEIWFGDRFNETGAVSKLWLKLGQERKRFPTYLGDDQLPNGQFFRFSDGSVFLRASPSDDPALFPAPVEDVPPVVSPADWPTAELIDRRIERSNNANGRQSPLTGKGQAFVELGTRFGINPGIVCAILQNESQLGADGSFLPTELNNFGGNTAGPNGEFPGPCGKEPRNGRFWKKFCTPEEGLEGVFANLNSAIYRNTGGRFEAVMEIYTPTNDNTEEAIRQMWETFIVVGEELEIPIDRDLQIYATP